MNAIPIRTAADMLSCDHCDRPVESWPTGLIVVTREIGMFGGDFTTCPECTPGCTFGPDALTGQLANGIEFEYIDWYWFIGGSL